jgi:hypothetical protein
VALPGQNAEMWQHCYIKFNIRRYNGSLISVTNLKLKSVILSPQWFEWTTDWNDARVHPVIRSSLFRFQLFNWLKIHQQNLLKNTHIHILSLGALTRIKRRLKNGFREWNPNFKFFGLATVTRKKPTYYDGIPESRNSGIGSEVDFLGNELLRQLHNNS